MVVEAKNSERWGGRCGGRLDGASLCVRRSKRNPLNLSSCQPLTVPPLPAYEVSENRHGRTGEAESVRSEGKAKKKQ